MINTITELCAKYKSDKGIINTTDDKNTFMHKYSLIYDDLFESIRDQSINILEIGCWGANQGGSAKMWKEYFVNGNVYGIDINPDSLILNDIGIKTMILDSTDENSAKLAYNFNTKFDIIIDDGYHLDETQIKNLYLYLNMMKSDSMYIVEDIAHSIDLLYNLNRKIINFKYLSADQNLFIQNNIKEFGLMSKNQSSQLAVFIKK